METKKQILVKARLSFAYCTSAALFADLDKVKQYLLPQDVFELFRVWDYWTFVNKICESCFSEKKFDFLENAFMNEFSKFVKPFEWKIFEYIKACHIGSMERAEELLLLEKFLFCMLTCGVFEQEKTQLHLSKLRQVLADLRASLGL